MRVLVVGSGGREAAIAWACRKHGHDVTRRAGAGRRHRVGRRPRDPRPRGRRWPAGIADVCVERGIPCFGPTRRTGATGVVEDVRPPARRRTRDSRPPIRPLRRRRRGAVMVGRLRDRRGGQGRRAAGGQGRGRTDRARRDPRRHPRRRRRRGIFLLEERLRGPECSLLALCDGTTAVALPLAQDHKRIGEADTGPNTGGMGAYAPAPVPYSADDLLATFVQPVLDHFAAAGTPYVGVIYAGPDVHRRRSAIDRVQRPLRRSRGASGHPAARDRPRRTRAGVHERLGARRAPEVPARCGGHRGGRRRWISGVTGRRGGRWRTAASTMTAPSGSTPPSMPMDGWQADACSP